MIKVLELLNADLRARGVTYDEAKLGKRVGAIWPHVQRSWDFEASERPLVKPSDPKATYKRVQRFFKEDINTTTDWKVRRATEEDQPAIWGELTRMAIHHGFGQALPAGHQVTELLRIGEWRIEKAKTSRGSCRVCGRSITEGELRFGQDTKNATWFHLACGAEGAPRAFRPFAQKANELLINTPASKPRPTAATGIFEGKTLDRKGLAVLIDWLQSTGDAWGELLALEAAKKTREAKAHLVKHGSSLTGTFGLRPFEWKGGFIDAAALQGTPKHLASQVIELGALRTAVRLRRLSLTAKTDHSVFAAISTAMPATLRELELQWPSKGIEALTLPKLESLHIRLKKAGDDLLEKATLPALRSLTFQGNRGASGEFGDGVVLSIAFLNRLFRSNLIKQLRRIEFDFGALDENGCLHVITHKAALSHVREVRLGAGPANAPLGVAMRKAFKRQLPR